MGTLITGNFIGIEYQEFYVSDSTCIVMIQYQYQKRWEITSKNRGKLEHICDKQEQKRKSNSYTSKDECAFVVQVI
jgi:hypothetical protein